ncbi:hypothetical protein [Sphingomonas sp.]|uniref:hypothetical protein n=1 Tax=Sphingomonas sp. TaxID=28214 RepID=UPI0025FADA10|nr:hypothetical protein [Sphingomonas sp.]
MQTLLQRGGGERFGRRARAVDRLDPHRGGNLIVAVEEGLAHDQHRAIVRQRQPVAGHARLAHDDLEATVRAERHIRRVQLPGGGHRAVDRIAVRLGAEAQDRHRSAIARETIGSRAADRGVHVDIVGIIRADLRGRMRGGVEAGEIAVRILQMHVERDAGEAGEVAIALRPVDRRVGDPRTQHDLADRLQPAAEIAPRRARGDALLGVPAHGAIYWPPLTSSDAPETTFA